MNCESPTPLEIATLASRFLPEMALPDRWENQPAHELSEIISRASVPRESVEGLATPFEVIAEEAVRRARILLDAAAGIKRPQREEFMQSGEGAREQLKATSLEKTKLTKKFSEIADGKDKISIIKVLEIALPRVEEKNAFAYWREYLRNSIVDYRQKHKLPQIEVKFADEVSRDEMAKRLKSLQSHYRKWRKDPLIATGNFPKIRNFRGKYTESLWWGVLEDHGRDDYQVSKTEFPHLVLGLQNYHSIDGERLRKKWSRESGLKGGEKVQENLRKEKEASLQHDLGASNRQMKIAKRQQITVRDGKMMEAAAKHRKKM